MRSVKCPPGQQLSVPSAKAPPFLNIVTHQEGPIYVAGRLSLSLNFLPQSAFPRSARLRCQLGRLRPQRPLGASCLLPSAGLCRGNSSAPPSELSQLRYPETCPAQCAACSGETVPQRDWPGVKAQLCRSQSDLGRRLSLSGSSFYI